MDFWTKYRLLEQCVDALFEKTLYICSSDGGASKHLILSCFVRDITRVDIITFTTKTPPSPPPNQNQKIRYSSWHRLQFGAAQKEEDSSKKEQICNKSRDLSRLEYIQAEQHNFSRPFSKSFCQTSIFHPFFIILLQKFNFRPKNSILTKLSFEKYLNFSAKIGRYSCIIYP